MDIDIKQYIAPLRKWWWLIVLTTLVAGVSSFLATRQQTPTYRSSTRLQVGNAYEDITPSNADISLGKTLATFYVDLANRNEVRATVAQNLGLTVDQLPRGIIVRQINDTSFIDITVTAESPELAQAVAAELANQLVLRTPTGQEDNEFVSQLLADYEMQIQDTEAEIQIKQAQVGETDSAREIAALQEEIRTLESTRQSLTSSYTQLLSYTQQGSVNTISVIDPAPLPRNAIVPNNTITILTAAGIGFVLSASAAYVLEYLDDSVKTSEGVMRLTGLRVLAGIAQIKIKDDHKLITLAKPRSPTSEAFRILRTSLQFAAGDSSHHSLLVTSAVPGEGKSTTAANLAVVIAQAGHRAVLIDCDLRRPSQHEVFGFSLKQGLTNILANIDGETDDETVGALIEEEVQMSPVEDLHILTSGPIPPNPSELLGSGKMKRLLKYLQQSYDFVLFDSPPVLSVTDAAILSAQADSTLFVIQANKSRRNLVQQAVKRLREVDAQLVGSVFNAVPKKGDATGEFYYYRDPYYTIDDEEEESAKSQSPAKKVANRLIGKQTQTV